MATTASDTDPSPESATEALIWKNFASKADKLQLMRLRKVQQMQNQPLSCEKRPHR